MAETARIAAEFDRIAAFGQEGSARYDRWVMARLPEHSNTVLEIGCGAGRLTSKLAERARSVIALDVSAGMLERARQRCRQQPHVRFVAASVTEWEPPARESLDAIVCVATLHHLAAPEAALARWATWLRPGGSLVIVDLVSSRGARDRVTDLAAMALRGLLIVTGRRRLPTVAERAAWAEHTAGERYPTLAEMRSTASLLPGTHVERLLMFRYGLSWTKPAR